MSQFKKKLTTFGALLTFLSVGVANADALNNANFIGGTNGYQYNTSVAGQAQINNTTGVEGSVVQGDWNSLNVGPGEWLNFGYSGLSQVIINRVLGGDVSQIYGKVTDSCVGGSCTSYGDTGRVVLINPAGVIFGAGSAVDLNSLTVSTFDFTGAKNIKDMTESELASYQKNVLDKMSSIPEINGEGRNYGTMTFDSNYQGGFVYTPGKTIRFDNANVYVDKSFDVVADNIEYKDSLLRTADNYNFVNYDKTFSNTRLVTADGVTFRYLSNGYSDDYSVANDSKTNVVRTVSIDNSGLLEKDPTNPAIQTGDLHIINQSNAAGSDINITNSIIKATKLVNNENGDILIKSSHDVNIANSRLETDNTTGVAVSFSYTVTDKNGNPMYTDKDGNIGTVNSNGKLVYYDTDGNSHIGGDAFKLTKTKRVAYNGTSTDEATIRSEITNQYKSEFGTDFAITNFTKKSTVDQAGGRVYIIADGSAAVDGSSIITAGATSAADSTSATSGAVKIFANGDKATVTNSKILAQGDINVHGIEKANISNSLLMAENTVDASKTKDITVTTSGNVNIENTVIDATNNVDITSRYSNNAVAGNIVISSTPSADGSNQTLLRAGNKLSIQGANTNIDDASLVYKDLKFYEDGTTGLNNVTIADNTTFNKVGSSVIDIETNGQLTFDNATVKGGAYNLKVTEDDNTVHAVDYSLKVTTANAKDVNATSTQKDVVAKNNTNINTTNDINFTSQQGAVKLTDTTLNAKNNVNILAQGTNVESARSNIKAGNDANLTAQKGALKITDNNVINGGNDVNLTSYDTINFGAKGDSTVNIDNSTNNTAGRNIKVQSTNGDINAEKTTMPTLTYGNRLTFNAKGDNNFTSKNSLKSVNVDYVAGGANKFYTEGDNQFVNSTLQAPENFVESGHDVILNNTTIKQATTNAKDTVTNIYANGIVTTDDVTGTAASDVAQTTHKYPQSVSTVRTGTDKTTLDINQTKLNVKTEVVKDASNPDNGSITLDLKNANNKEAGVELTAINVDALDQDPTGGNFKPGYYKEGTSKWDENIAAHEGPEVHINAVDDELSVSKIITDKLTMDPNDDIYAAPVELTPEQLAGLPEGTESAGYIEVKDQGGFNFDPNDGYNPDPENFNYSGNYDTHEVKVEGGESTTVTGDPYVIDKSEVTKDNKTYTTTTYGQDTNTTTTDKITTTTDKKHTIEFDNSGNPSKFILVYDKTKTDVQKFEPVKETKTWTVTTSKDCPDAPDVTPNTSDLDSYVNITKLPKEQVEVSKTSKVSDNTIDQTSNIMSAAAKVEIVDEDNNTSDSTDNQHLSLNTTNTQNVIDTFAQDTTAVLTGDKDKEEK